MRPHSGPENGTATLDDTGPGTKPLAGWIGANGMKSALIATAFLAALVSLLIAFSTSDADAASVCDKTASSNVQRLVDSLRPGQTGCLRGGVYTNKQVVFKNSGHRGDRIALRSYPGKKVEFRGSIHIPEGSNYVTLRGMRLDGSYGSVGKGHFKRDRNTGQTVKVMGDNVSIRNNNITNRRPSGNPDLAGTCIILGSGKTTAANTSIEGNRIHHCGQMPRINREHGIYTSNPRNAVIQDNLIYNNADRGVQLYPDARGTLVSGNVVDGNGVGLLIGAKSSQNTVRNNVFSNPSDGWNINLGPTSSGSGNRVSNNCFWSSGGKSALNKGGKNTSISGNVTAKPRYKNGFKVTNRTCLGKYNGTQAR